MALLKEIETKSGVVVSYWKITDWKINMAAKSVDITLTPYVDTKTRQNGYEPVRDAVQKIRATDYYVKEGSPTNRTDYTDYFSPNALNEMAQNQKSIYQVMYEYIKSHVEDFKEAKDI